MRPKDMVLRCYAESEGGIWHAVCVDLSLAAQADSLNEARDKLHAQIAEYLVDALAGEDQPYADQLLERKSPWSLLAKYHFLKFQQRFDRAKACLFKETLPMVPAVA